MLRKLSTSGLQAPMAGSVRYSIVHERNVPFIVYCKKYMGKKKQ
jgi:hypothetical protein